MSYLRAAATALVAAFVVTGCSDDSNNTTAPNTPAPATPGAQAQSPDFKQTRTGLVAPITDPAFNGTLKITRFAVKNGQLLADGVVNGTTGTGQAVKNLQVRNIPVTTGATGEVTTQAACQILHLDIGPIFLDLLGLQLSTNEIVIDLTAVSGPGNLLGNLLCALVGLLDQPPLNIGLINQILAQINNLLNQL